MQKEDIDYDRLHRVGVRFLRKQRVPLFDAEALVQEALVRICTGGLPQDVLEDPDPDRLVRYFFGMVRKIKLQALRSERVDARAVEAICRAQSGCEPAQESAADEVASCEEICRVRKALKRLPGKYSQLLQARHAEGMTDKEIGDRLGLRRETVNRHMRLAEEALVRELLKV